MKEGERCHSCNARVLMALLPSCYTSTYKKLILVINIIQLTIFLSTAQ